MDALLHVCVRRAWCVLEKIGAEYGNVSEQVRTVHGVVWGGDWMEKIEDDVGIESGWVVIGLCGSKCGG